MPLLENKMEDMVLMAKIKHAAGNLLKMIDSLFSLRSSLCFLLNNGSIPMLMHLYVSLLPVVSSG